jgi:hypothetical protein
MRANPRTHPLLRKGWATPGCTNRSPRDALCYFEVKYTDDIMDVCRTKMVRRAERVRHPPGLDTTAPSPSQPAPFLTSRAEVPL